MFDHLSDIQAWQHGRHGEYVVLACATATLMCYNIRDVNIHVCPSQKSSLFRHIFFFRPKFQDLDRLGTFSFKDLKKRVWIIGMISKKVSNLLWNHCALCTASTTDNAQRRCYYQTINLAVMVASLSPSTYTHIKLRRTYFSAAPFLCTLVMNKVVYFLSVIWHVI